MMQLGETANYSIEEVVDLLEHMKNATLWVQREVTMFIVVLCIVISFLLYLLQNHMHYLLMLAGGFKFTKMFLVKYGFKSKIPAHLKKGNPILNIAKRVPTDREIEELKLIPEKGRKDAKGKLVDPGGKEAAHRARQVHLRKVE